MFYVVERYLPGLSRADLLPGLSRLESAIEKLHGEGCDHDWAMGSSELGGLRNGRGDRHVTSPVVGINEQRGDDPVERRARSAVGLCDRLLRRAFELAEARLVPQHDG